MTEITSGLALKIDVYPAHVRAGLIAYRAALNLRKDWHQAVAAAIHAAEQAKDGGHHNGRDEEDTAQP